MPSKESRSCTICHRPSIINLSHHLNGVHEISRQKRKQLSQKGIVIEPQSYIKKNISYF